jgi:YD repeat-containing protein
MNARTLLLTLSLCLAASPALWADDHECSVATLHGAFAFTFTGTARTASGVSQRGGIGRYEWDGRGNLVGSITSNADGVVLRRALIGTYTVDEDCTGTIAVDFLDALGGHATFDMIIDDDGREVRTVSTPPPGAVNPATLTAVFRKQFSRR